MVLFSKLYEREGNDGWLKDYIEIIRNPLGLYFNHTLKHTGWAGDVNENYQIEIDVDDLNDAQQKIDLHLKNVLLEDEFQIKLEEILYEKKRF
jgi:hypothetical protein